ncbi:M20/M25/M40 family metallo-hydrolase [Anaerolentibacter hominis]|uniref:M20/M25/M40 family metallo-hydrolase n=1 Tax=Anaerolentibacter hominis TaxID=3079009 RepID=UPI0031B8443A
MGTVNETYVKHLQGMVRIPTISNVDPAKMDFTRFQEFQDYLQEIYPLIHKTMEKKVLGQANLLFKWTGKKSDKLPVLLMAHQDVVPEGDHSKWIHPPYSGEVADGCIWGRGSGDCKCVILAEMEAVEELIGKGFEPDFDIYLAYAQNEEVQAEEKGARMIVDYLKDQGVRLGCVFDEGSGVTSGESMGYDGYVCRVELGEKAFHDYEIYKECAGGHSMEPGQGTALGSIAKAIVVIEANPFPYRLTDLVENQLKALGKCMTGRMAEIYGDPRNHWEELTELAKEDKKLDSLLHTTCAVTMASGSAQSNILPERASAIMNCRVLEGDTAESLLAHFRALIPEDVQIRLVFGEDPAPASSVEGRPYRLIEEIAKDTYGDNLLMVPGLLAGGTDSRFYGAVCDNVFRHSGYFRDERWGRAHQVNEKVPCDALESGVKFYRELLLRY